MEEVILEESSKLYVIKDDIYFSVNERKYDFDCSKED
jgi:hypothetical protein